jgi:cell division protein FtsN
MSDEGFHEIQLNGKQLVFLFMAATVVSVVIFLCGVLVGRGIRVGQPDEGTATAATGGPAPLAPPVETPPAQPPPAVSEAPARGELSYYDRLQREGAPPEGLKPAEARPSSTPVASPPPVREAPPATPTETTPEKEGAGFAVQVAALRDKREADAVVQKLIGEGYRAYVLAPVKGAPAPVYRVRVGRFKDRREAEDAARRLEKEQFKPWIVR